MKQILITVIAAVLAAGCGAGETIDILKSDNDSLKLALDNEKKVVEQLKNERNQMQTNLIEANNLNLVLFERIAVIETELEDSNEPASDFNYFTNINDNEIILIWNSAIDKILINLNRVKKADLALLNDKFTGRFEANRLTMFARNYEARALTTVSELRLQKFPKSDILEKQITLFTSNYCAYLSSVRSSVDRIPFYASSGTGFRAEAARRKAAYLNKTANQKIYQAISTNLKNCHSNLNYINRLKIKIR
jgi:hypothetical protein